VGRFSWILLTAGVLVACAGAWVAQQARGDVGRTRQAREALFAELQPVKLRTCELARYGEDHDGGYLACRNLLSDVRSAYSYGISGYDGWGCEVSTELNVPVHQYDCFDTRHPSCPTGTPIFHAECIASSRSTDAQGRVFDSMENQIASNGDSEKHIIVKVDVEGAEWDSMLKTPDPVFERIDQMIFEFHGVDRNIARSREVILRLKKFFHVAHLHINNYSCRPGLQPFGGWAYEVTFVSKRLATVDPGGTSVRLPNPLDSRNNPVAPDCQVPPGSLR
jgi:hypothetical protein